MAGSHHVCSEEKQYKIIEMNEKIQSSKDWYLTDIHNDV
jgi:hypothetical protein